MVPRSRTRVQPRRPDQVPEEPPPRRQTRHRVAAPSNHPYSPGSHPLFSRRTLRLRNAPPAAQVAICYLLSMFSRGRPRQLETEEELYDVALRALMRRAHSAQEMRKKLSRYTRNDLLVGAVMARLKENGQLNDQRYAQQFARNRTQSRKQGGFRIARELRARGIADADINAALETSAAEIDPAALVRQRIERKLKSFRGEMDERRMASIYASLLRAGFPADLIRRELKRLTREEVPESDSQP